MQDELALLDQALDADELLVCARALVRARSARRRTAPAAALGLGMRGAPGPPGRAARLGAFLGWAFLGWEPFYAATGRGRPSPGSAAAAQPRRLLSLRTICRRWARSSW
jgi:hypothetical protein